MYRKAAFEPYRGAGNYAIAGTLYAMIMGSAGFLAISENQVDYRLAPDHPRLFLSMVWTCAWPVVLTTNIVAAVGRLKQWFGVLTYFVVLFALAGSIALTFTETTIQVGNLSIPAWPGESPHRLILRWNLFNLAPTLLILTFRYRRLRAIAPLVLSFMTVVSAGLLGLVETALIHNELSAKGLALVMENSGLGVTTALMIYFLVLFAIACLFFGALGWWLLLWMRNAYQRKTISDQSLAIDALWAVFTAFHAAILASYGPGWALVALVAFIVFKITVNIGNKRLRFTIGTPDFEPSLLVLRVFSLGKRSENLFDAVTKHWRHVGKVRLIAGQDLAFSTVAPHQFLAFVTGKLNQLFIRGETSVDRSIGELDNGRDADGRFRINELFCYADTWKCVLTRLIKTTDVVLMDLRSFKRKNAGCVFEIRELMNLMPLNRVVFVVDKTTDRDFLKEIWQEVCHELRPDSPNIGVTWSTLRPIELRSLADVDLRRLLRRMCAAINPRHCLLSG
ncbi:MAG: hypothetical protein ACRER2_13475 [Methylococcales bacterium]